MNSRNYRITGFLNLWIAAILVIPAAATAEQVPAYEAREESKEIGFRLPDLGQIQECETLEGQQEICGTWTWDRKAQAFNATWQNGATAVLKVEKMEGGEIVLMRRDLSGPSVGLSVRYFGFNAGSTIEGDVAIQLLKGTILGGSPGSPSGGTWHARSHFLLDLGQSE